MSEGLVVLITGQSTVIFARAYHPILVSGRRWQNMGSEMTSRALARKRLGYGDALKPQETSALRAFQSFYRTRLKKKALKLEADLMWAQAEQYEVGRYYDDFLKRFPTDRRAATAERRAVALNRMQATSWPSANVTYQRRLKNGDIMLVVDVRDCNGERISVFGEMSSMSILVRRRAGWWILRVLKKTDPSTSFLPSTPQAVWTRSAMRFARPL